MGARVESALPGRYVLSWAARDGVGPATARAVVDRLRTTRDGDLQAHVRITVEAGGALYELHQGRLNLHAVRSRRELARALEERVPIADPVWEQVVEELCAEVIRREQEPTPVVELDRGDPGPVPWLVRPLVLDQTTTLWYAPGGSGKTYLALWLGLLVENGVAFRGREVRPRRVLYCDWEADEDETRRRLHALTRALGRHGLREARWPLYRRCLLPVTDEVSELSRVVAERDVGLVVVDSAGVACGGDVYSAEAALAFFRAVRRICAASRAACLVLTHVTKNDRREEHGTRLPLGSVYFENMPRLCWELRPEEQEDGDASLRLGLRCRKSNVGRQEALGIQLDWNEGEVDVRQLEHAPADKTAAALTSQAIVDALESGPAGVQEIADASGLPVLSIRKALTRLRKRGVIVQKQRGVWALSAEGEDA